MPFYDNEKCPVCGKQFGSDDDIVTCPYCGTPHHRECYNSLGHCVNSDKHGTDFEYLPNKNTPVDEKPFEQKQNEKSIRPAIDANGLNFRVSENEYDKSNETIDGKSIRDIAAVVRTNILRFIPKFKRNKKISWNWGAFFFGPYYLFFRKIYKQGFLFLALGLISDFIIQGAFSEQYQKFTDFMNSAMTQMQSNTVDDALTQEMMNNYQ
ncbi:MAG: RING finger protein, partial [Eubacterium sp.]